MNPILDAARKRIAIQSYRKRLGDYLDRKYSGHRTFTVPEVRAAARELGLSSDFLIYAYARYCSKESFDAHQRAVGTNESYADLRKEIVRVPKHVWTRQRQRGSGDSGGAEVSSGSWSGTDSCDGGGDAGGD